MKKIPLLLMALVLWIAPACDDDDDTTSIARGTLVVNYDFTGLSLTADTGATNRIYVYLYKVLSLFPYEYYTTETSSEPLTDSAQFDSSLTLDNVPAGNYYAVVFYDDNGSEKSVARNGDPYMIYVNDAGSGYQTASPYTALRDGGDEGDDPDGYVTITADTTTTITMDYDEGTGAAFQNQGAWDL